MKSIVPIGIMKWVPKVSTFVTNPKDPTCLRDLNLEGEKNHKKGGLNCVFENFFLTF